MTARAVAVVAVMTAVLALLAVACTSRGGESTAGSSAAPKAGPAKIVRGPYEGRVGVSGSLVWYDSAEQLAFLLKARQIGLSWVREDLHWGAFEAKPGAWNWTVGDRLMGNASRAGVDVLGVVAYSAPWAASGPTIYHPPSDPAAYAEFCRRLVERYGPGGAFWRDNPDLQPRPLRALEIWNEPWYAHFWRPVPDPAAYARLVRAAAGAINAADPSVKVLASADVFQLRPDTTELLDWFRLLLEADPDLFRTHVDAYSVHLYSQDRGPLDASVEPRLRFDRALITRDLAAAADASHPLWITELGWTTNPSHTDAVTEATQARYMRQALDRVVGEWGDLVEKSFIYHWGRDETDDLGGYGPLRADGTSKPVFSALATFLRATPAATAARTARKPGARAATLRVLTANPRYFTDGSGRAVYLTGSHVWWNLVGGRTWKVDCEHGRAEPFDYNRYLDMLGHHGHNFIRLWRIELTRWEECGETVRIGAQPWLRTGPGNALDGLPRFDLTRFDPAYFRRLRQRVRAAQARGFYVSVMLFEGWGLQWQGEWRWRSHPFHAPNNVNGVEGDANRDGSGVESHTLAVPAVTRIQEAYVRRVIAAVNAFDNVLYEIANESGRYSTDWQYRMIELVKREQLRRGKVHPVGMTFQHAHGQNENLYRSRADWISPAGLEYMSDPPPADGRKIVISDTDHHCGGCGDQTFAWRSFLRGHNPIYMDSLEDDQRKGSIRSTLGQTRRYAQRIDLARMHPRGELASTGYALASSGREYLVYQPDAGAFTLDLRGAGGQYAVEWFDPGYDRVYDGGTVAGGGVVTFTPPVPWQAVLYLRRVGGG